MQLISEVVQPYATRNFFFHCQTEQAVIAQDSKMTRDLLERLQIERQRGIRFADEDEATDTISIRMASSSSAMELFKLKVYRVSYLSLPFGQQSGTGSRGWRFCEFAVRRRVCEV